MKFSDAILRDIDRRGRRVLVDAELRAENPDGSIPVRWYPAVFGQRANIYGMFLERFAAGAFAKTIQEGDIRALINHDANLVLGRTKASTLKLAEDRKGLVADVDMPPTSYALDLRMSLERGDVNQGSIGFRSIRETWDDSGKIPLRTIDEAQLFDVSIVTYPAYEGTSATLRSVQFDAMVRALGLDEVEAEEREALLMQVTAGDIAPEFRPVLLRAQERIGQLAAAGEEPPRTTETDEPAKSHSGDRERRERRRLLQMQMAGVKE